MSNILDRFLEAQETTYESALSEIKAGLKRSHWMWFIFPQYKGLGFSSTTKFYAIDSIKEAQEYLNHPILGKRLREISNELLLLESNDITSIMGVPDDKKLQSSMTLFAEIEASEENVFLKVIEKYYNGNLDPRTLMLINE
ncbi:MAG TPA: DUF1810 domain-containing protein [Chitinophagales bacterium]|nr:DUF1810 domain-containing protein [Chitinophagales bacterium]